jgi:stalled ribosome alternative rescue factor ArfA
MDKRHLKKTGQELQDYLAFRRRGSTVKAKKGKGSYSRKKFKKEVA